MKHMESSSAIRNLASLSNPAHGYVIIPILLVASKIGVLDIIKTKKTVKLVELSETIKADSGYLRVVLSILEALQIVELIDEKIYFKDTNNLLRDIKKIPDHILDLYEINPLTNLQDFMNVFSKRYFNDFCENWPTIKNEHLKNFLDGIIIIPILVGLRHLVTADVVSNKIKLESFSLSVSKKISRFLSCLGWLESSDSKIILLNDSGGWFLQNAYNYALGLSYRPLLSKLERVVTGNPNEIFSHQGDDELHVDRVLNVLSSGSMHKNYFKILSESVVDIFNNDDLKQQPSYIVDTGCGDGTLLKELYQKITKTTLRGKYLDKYPLLMVGVDYSKASQEQTSQKLSRLGIPHLVLFGDISKPAEICESLKMNGIDMTKRILHVRSFLDHDRSYVPPEYQDDQNEMYANFSSGYIDNDGSLIPDKHLFSNLKEHLQKWADILENGSDLLILEVHNMSAEMAFLHKEDSVSLYFDALQAFSKQLLVPADKFFSAAANAGLISKELVSFPEEKEFSRITFNHFKKQNYRIRRLNVSDKSPVLDLALQVRSFDREVFSEWLDSQFAKNAGTHFVLEEEVTKDNFEITGVIYTTSIKNKKEGFRRIYDSKPQLDWSYNIVQILDVHVYPEKFPYYRNVLFEYIEKLCKLVDKCAEFVILTRSLPIVEGFDSYDYLSQLRSSDDVELFSMLQTDYWEAQSISACDGFIRLLLSHSLAYEETDCILSQKKHLTESYIIDFLNQEISQILGDRIRIDKQVSILSLGLDSLQIAKLIANLNRHFSTNLSLNVIFQEPKIGSLIFHCLGSLNSRQDYAELEASQPLEIKHELSLPQESMWIWYKLVGQTSAYNVPRIEHFRGEFSHDTLKKALSYVMERHAILRTRYNDSDGVPMQEIVSIASLMLPISFVDLSKKKNKTEKSISMVRYEANKPFDLYNDFALRLLHIKLNEKEHILVINFHHIVTDGSSIPVFWDELTEAYNSFLNSKNPKMLPLNIDYFNWSIWQRKRLETNKFDKQIDFWKQKLSGNLPTLKLPVDYDYPEIQSYNGDRIRFEISETETNILKTLCTEENVTLFMFIASIWAAFLARHADQDEVIVGTPWANREIPEVNNLIGCFVNTLPLRISLGEEPSIRELLGIVKQVTIEAFRNASVPFHKVVENLSIPTSPKRLPIYLIVTDSVGQSWVEKG